MVDGRARTVAVRRRRGRATRTIGQDTRAAAAACPTALAARVFEEDQIMSPTEMESHTVGHMARIAIIPVYNASRSTPITTPILHEITAWTEIPGTLSKSSNRASSASRSELKGRQ